ncbi:hypothetical protein [Sediminicola luteus]|uniref:Periplasmic heavy metal sensor n=1 Tax=Sediminicola luteus TaxID=319238 RepID=A0A2A4G8G6_9FLAO|nr:hypothetical protein [Sediminicola luteus]PCE64286.1 hypothetical protein B7P33_08260 [Sediminicola luteus]
MRTLVSVAFLFISFGLTAQDCTLGIATAPLKTLEGVFQLNHGQVVQLKTLKEVVNTQLRREQQKVDNLLASHPQETPEQLTELGKKHELLVEGMETITAEYDIKFLQILNERQYERYMKLCVEVGRIPLRLPEPEETDN